MASPEVAYFEHRATVEAEMAKRARSPAAVKAHYELSKAYFEQVETLKRKTVASE